MMDKKMTSGEIAKKAGISQKAVRLYDEKGLLKPSEYSEGNYRLYDKEALLVLENIIALKQIGFSLEEIHDNLIQSKNMDIVESLNQQLKLMEERKREIERTIGCIKSVLVRTNGQPDWNSVAEVARMIQADQKADTHHFSAIKHNADGVDWYVKIYDSLNIKSGARILDLGCGFGKLWRNNWADIPASVTVDAVDLHGSWADNLAGYIEENRKKLQVCTDVQVKFGDVEEAEVWNEVVADKKYTCVIAHYLLSFLKNEELLTKRAADALAEGGMFSCNAYGIGVEDGFWAEMLENIGIGTGFIAEKQAVKKEKHESFRKLLEKYFKAVELVKLSNNMQYDNSGELFERLCERYPEKKKYFTEKEALIKKCFDKEISEQGRIVVPGMSEFWHCYK